MWSFKLSFLLHFHSHKVTWYSSRNSVLDIIIWIVTLASLDIYSWCWVLVWWRCEWRESRTKPVALVWHFIFDFLYQSWDLQLVYLIKPFYVIVYTTMYQAVHGGWEGKTSGNLLKQQHFPITSSLPSMAAWQQVGTLMFANDIVHPHQLPRAISKLCRNQLWATWSYGLRGMVRTACNPMHTDEGVSPIELSDFE